MVLNIDSENEKFSLGIKQLEKDPWQEVEKALKKGSVIEGKVTKTVDFGLFVSVAPYVEGLVHISQLQDKRTERVDEVVKPGDTVVVRVREVDERGRINLTMRGITKEEKDKALAE